jgi:hypothetical protein
MEAGVLTSASALRVLLGYPAALPALELDESEPADHAIGIAGRTAAFLFIDFPLAFYADLVNLSVFGSGARERELGQSATFQFGLVPPYSWIFGWSGFYSEEQVSGPIVTTGDRLLSVDAAPFEAGYFSAATVNRRLAQSGGRLEYADVLLYLGGKLAYYDQFLSLTSPASSPMTGPLLQIYVADLNERFNLFRLSDEGVVAGRLQRAWFAGFIDPTFWLSFYHLFVGRLWNGERVYQVPMIEVGDLSIYPATRFNLSPFGAEHYLDVFVHAPGVTFAPYARFSSSGLATDVGGGLAILGWTILSVPEVQLGADLDLWAQPEILLAERNVFSRPTLLGGSIAGRLDMTIAGGVGVIAKLAYKTRGYLMAQPVEAGTYGFAGIRLAL